MATLTTRPASMQALYRAVRQARTDACTAIDERWEQQGARIFWSPRTGYSFYKLLAERHAYGQVELALLHLLTVQKRDRAARARRAYLRLCARYVRRMEHHSAAHSARDNQLWVEALWHLGWVRDYYLDGAY